MIMDLGNIDWEKLGIVFPQEEETCTTEGEEMSESKSTFACRAQKLRVHMERKGRGGKVVTIVSGFMGEKSDLSSLATALKTTLGLGGSVKNGLILLQGDCRTRVIDWLKSQGYRDVK